ncbi:tripartite tricarboxylate transporter substrate binding protein [Vibrio nigripulchritudo]|uniref:tripartite tricarboxylate transporter substrate binding protein n=2 Tax=Vibrio nigripulchritudo TaxID=28173 RepID=UPI0002D9D901|nr:tripartite tricarboxylate transporter substrate binding protein [Vibrio nigripulchritudo]
MMKRIFSILTLIWLTVWSVHSSANNWPKRNIQLTVGYGAGGTTDSTARVLAKLLEDDLGKKVVVVNKPGGGGAVAASLAKGARPNGYALFTFTTGAAVLSPHMQTLPYDPLNDFTLIAQFAQWNLGIVAPADAPYDSLPQLIDYAKKHPGKLSYAVAGSGTPQHLTMERLANRESLEWKAVPFKGGAASVTALLGKHVDFMVGATEWLPQVQSGEFKLLAIITDKKMKQFPDVPTLLDLGYPISAPSILGIAGPKGIPQDIVEKLSLSILKASGSKDMEEIIQRLAMQTSYLGPKDFRSKVEQEYEIQGAIIQQAGLGK